MLETYRSKQVFFKRIKKSMSKIVCNYLRGIFNLPIRWILSKPTTLLSSVTAPPTILPTPSVLKALHVYSESMKFDVSKTY